MKLVTLPGVLALTALAACATNEGSSVTSYHGCYQGATWTIAPDLTVTGDCTPGGPSQTDFVQGCDGEDSCGGPIIL